MATQGRPNISLLPIAGAEITRARERQQAVGLQAAMARLQAQAQAAALEERAREFDVNAQLRREATVLDERFRQQQLGFQRQQFQQRTQQARFAQELSVEQLGLQGQELQLSFERESRIAEQAEQEFGFRSEQFQEAKRRADVAEGRLTRTEAQKRFQTFFNLFKESEGTLFTVDPDAPRGRMVTFDQTKAAPLLEQMAEAFSQAFGRDFSINELQNLLNPQLTRAVEERQRVRGQQELAAERTRQSIRESQSLEFARINPPETRGRAAAATPQQQFAQRAALAEFGAAVKLETEAFAEGVTPTQRDELLTRANVIKEAAQKRFESAVSADPSAFQLPAATRQEQFRQFIGKPQVAGAPTAAGQAAEPTDFAAASREDLERFFQEVKEEAQGFQSPSRFATTISKQDRLVIQGYIGNGLRVTEAQNADTGFTQLLNAVNERKKEFQEAFTEVGQELPQSQERRFDSVISELKRLKNESQIGIQNIRRIQQQALNTMSGEGALVVNAHLENERVELNDFIKNLESQRDDAVNDTARAGFQGQIDGANTTLANLAEMRGKVKEKAGQPREDFFNVDRMAATFNAAFRGIPATNPEVSAIMSEIGRDVDRVVAEVFGETEFFSTQSGSRGAKRERGQAHIKWLREGGVWAAWGEDGDTLELGNLANTAAVGEVFTAKGLVLGVFPFVPRGLRIFKEIVTGRVPETDLIAGWRIATPHNLRPAYDNAIDKLSQKPKIVIDPVTREPRIDPVAAEGEITRDEMLQVSAILMSQENPENIVAHLYALLIKGRDKNIDKVDVWRALIPFDKYKYLTDPRKAAEPSRNIGQQADLFD